MAWYGLLPVGRAKKSIARRFEGIVSDICIFSGCMVLLNFGHEGIAYLFLRDGTVGGNSGGNQKGFAPALGLLLI